MTMIIEFPNSNERNWREIETDLRESCSKLPNGIAALEECLPAIRSHWQKIFIAYSVQPGPLQMPGSLTDEQIAAILAARETGMQLVVKQLRHERNAHFSLLIMREFHAAYFHLTGIPLDL